MEKITVLFCIVNIVFGTTVNINNNTATTQGSTEGNSNMNVSVVPGYSTVSSNNSMCEIVSIDTKETKATIQNLLGEGKKIITMYLSFVNQIRTFSHETNGDIYQPLTWIHTSGRYGSGLLLLRHSYPLLSLGTLSFDNGELQVKVTDNPKGCLRNSSIELFENSVRKFLLKYYDIKKTDTSESICNLHVDNKKGRAVYRYYCCRSGDDGQPLCSELEPDIWMQLLHAIIYILQIVGFLLSPLLIPKSWYSSKSESQEYVLNLKQPAEARAMKQNGSYVLGQGKFIKLNKLRIMVKVHKLVAKDYVPVGILESLYNNFVRCNIRKEKEMTACCYGNVCGTCMDGRCTFRWFKCCQMFLQIIFLLIILLPFFLWQLEYYLVEDIEYTSRLEASMTRGLYYYYEGSITTLPLSHWLFHAAITIVLLVLVTFSLIKSISKCLQSPFYTLTTSLMRTSFLNMRESRQTRVTIYKGAIISLLFPFSKFGIFALTFVVFYWVIFIPVTVIIFAVYSFPAINLLIRVIGWTLAVFSKTCTERFCGCIKQLVEKSHITRTENRLFETDQHKLPSYTRDKGIATRLLTALYAIILFVSLLAAFLLIFDCIGFYVLVVVYFFVGIVVNISQTLKYVIIAIMIILHARDCFSGISAIYLNFSQSIIQLLVNLCNDEVEKVTIASENTQENTAFQVARISDNGVDSIEEVEFLTSDDEYKSKVRRMVLFVDKKDKPYITDKFFFKACYMDHVGCPGPLLPHFTKAMGHMLSIISFLVVIILILLAFGEETISSGNQTLITLVGGLLPFLFRSILFKGGPDSNLDVNNLNFRNGFNNMIENFVETFPVSTRPISAEELFADTSEENANEFDQPVSSDSVEIKMDRLDI